MRDQAETSGQRNPLPKTAIAATAPRAPAFLTGVDPRVAPTASDTAPSGLALSDLCIVVACNDEACLKLNLLASPLVAAAACRCMSNAARPRPRWPTTAGSMPAAPLVLFAHQDVWFPPGWEKRLARAIAQLQGKTPDWALLGPFGMSPEGRHMGDVWTTSMGRRVGTPVSVPQPVQSFDELAFVMRRDAGLRFDETLPQWHFYGTDIVQTALAAGRGAYVIDAPVIHNDGPKTRLGADFTARATTSSVASGGPACRSARPSWW